MPGPCNSKKKRDARVKKEKLRKERQFIDNQHPSPNGETRCEAQAEHVARAHSSCGTQAVALGDVCTNSSTHLTPVYTPTAVFDVGPGPCVSDSLKKVSADMTPYVYIYDPGNGPRVRDTRAFLSYYFAHPPSLDDPLCAEFAQEEVLQMLMTVLPQETALVRACDSPSSLRLLI